MATTASAPPAPNGFLFQSNLHDNSLLEEFTSRPISFGEPMPKNSWSFDVGTKEVIVGPRSPSPSSGSGSGIKAKKRSLTINGEGVVAGDSEAEEDDEEDEDQEGLTEQIRKKSKKTRQQSNGHDDGLGDSSSSTIPATSGQSPQKQKHKQQIDSTPKASTSSTPTAAQGLYPVEVDLRWPEAVAHAKRAAGLYNPSMACYANATLQVLLHTPPVLRIALAHDRDHCGQRINKSFCMLCLLNDLATNDHWAGRKAYSPSEVHRSLGKLKKGFSKNRQEDTHEFFRFVTDALQATALYGKPKDLPEKLKHTSWVYRLWGGKVRSRVVCSRCNKPSDTFDDFLDLSLDVNRQGKKSISGMMTGFTREDKLEGDNKYHCDNCKGKAVATKSFKIERAPPILTLHLKRFSVNYNSYSGRARADKFNQFIEFGEFLDIAPYMVNPKTGGTRYRLFGVTCHRGVELRFGHYTSYVKGPSGQWFHADDEDMMPVKLDQVLSDKTAYLLSYIRIGEGSITPAKTPIGNGTPNSQLPNNVHRSVPSTPLSPTVSAKRRSGADSSDYEIDEDEESQEEEEEVYRPIVKRNGFIGPSTPDAWKPATSELDGAPSQGAPRGDDDMPPELPSKFGYNPNPKPKSGVPTTPPILAPKAIPPGSFYSKPSPIARPGNPLAGGGGGGSSGTSMSKKQLKKLRKKEKKFGSGANGGGKKGGAPMPYQQGRAAAGSSNWKPGIMARMKPRA
ncbi:hypothetical protein IAR55_006558 [Kwoniella newhampshirensis]|uniref:ubiquitinyl hydrolase 1 n=1 Tax=Kwoniella newhampshirensis TaxID=1651941 RepID=A0AAW0YU85_9TREE